ncbi:MAG: ATP-binding protein [Bacteroidia bacterium]|nr:ATP-binding protein [Bacteroidia bacterium]
MQEINNIQDIQNLITNQVEESIHLDYKAAESLGKSEGKKKEISKDVSAFANSDGGIIIYGIKEYADPHKKYLPELIDPIDRDNFSKEWLEQVIFSNINPRLRPDNIKIIPIPFDNVSNKVIYVVYIVKSTTAHQAVDLRYYRRNNFESIPLYDYEVRDIMNRNKFPKMEIVFQIEERTYEVKQKTFGGGLLEIPKQTKQKKEYATKKTLLVFAKNIGSVYAMYVNCDLEISKDLLDSEEYKYEKSFERFNIPLKKIYCDNTIREVKEVTSFLDVSYPKYWPSRYDPILPGTESKLKTIILNQNLNLDLAEGVIFYSVNADNAEKIQGELHIAEIKRYKTENTP